MSRRGGCVAEYEKDRCPGSARGRAPSGLERFDGRMGQFERPAAGAGVYRRFLPRLNAASNSSTCLSKVS